MKIALVIAHTKGKNLSFVTDLFKKQIQREFYVLAKKILQKK